MVRKSEHIRSIYRKTCRYNTFVLRRGIRNNRVLIFAHTVPHIDSAPAKVGRVRVSIQFIAQIQCLPPPVALQDVQCVYTNIESAGEQLRLAFNNFLCSVISALATHTM